MSLLFPNKINNKINSSLEEELRQWDNISNPKLFTSCLQYANISKINWDTRRYLGLTVQYLSHLIFADDIVLIANSTSKLQEMLNKISMTSASQQALRCVWGRLLVMCNKHVNKDDVIVDGKLGPSRRSFKNVNLGKMVTKNQDQVKDNEKENQTGMRVHSVNWTTYPCKTKMCQRDWRKHLTNVYFCNHI